MDIKHKITGETLETVLGNSLRKANLRGANLHWADLSEADLSGADLRGANLRGANLHWADLSGANLRWANLRGANLHWADLSEADLSEADLHWADLSEADLSEADLRGAIGNGSEIKMIQTSKYPIVYTETDMAIGCEQHTIDEWFTFDDETIRKMDRGALTWWRKWRPIIALILERTD